MQKALIQKNKLMQENEKQVFQYSQIKQSLAGHQNPSIRRHIYHNKCVDKASCLIQANQGSPSKSHRPELQSSYISCQGLYNQSIKKEHLQNNNTRSKSDRLESNSILLYESYEQQDERNYKSLMLDEVEAKYDSMIDKEKRSNHHREKKDLGGFNGIIGYRERTEELNQSNNFRRSFEIDEITEPEVRSKLIKKEINLCSNYSDDYPEDRLSGYNNQPKFRYSSHLSENEEANLAFNIDNYIFSYNTDVTSGSVESLTVPTSILKNNLQSGLPSSLINSLVKPLNSQASQFVYSSRKNQGYILSNKQLYQPIVSTKAKMNLSIIEKLEQQATDCKNNSEQYNKEYTDDLSFINSKIELNESQDTEILSDNRDVSKDLENNEMMHLNCGRKFIADSDFTIKNILTVCDESSKKTTHLNLIRTGEYLTKENYSRTNEEFTLNNEAQRKEESINNEFIKKNNLERFIKYLMSGGDINHLREKLKTFDILK